MRGAVGIAQGRLQLDARAVMGLDREGEQPARRQHARHGGGDWGEIAAINEHVGGEHEMMLRARLGGEELR